MGSGKVVLINEVTIKEKLGEFFCDPYFVTTWFSKKKINKVGEAFLFFFVGVCSKIFLLSYLALLCSKKEKQL